MSPVLPHSAPIFTIRRRPVRRPAVSFLPFSPVEPHPRPEAGALAQGAPGWCKGNLDSPMADCPPPQLQIPRAPLVGIARLAAQSPAAETKRQSVEKPEYFLLPVKSILNRCDSDRVPFEWTINPYRGCEFACKYCYARYTHEYMEIDGGDFEKKIFVKQDAAALLARDVSQKYSYESKASGYTQAEHIAIGTATDPYQPAEREYGVTRACLEELAKREGLSISIITKSNQIVRDIDILKVIASKSALTIDITVTTLKPRLARLLEPRAPRPDLRLSAVKELREAGLHVGVIGFTAPAGNHGRRRGIGARRGSGKSGGRGVVLLRRVVPDARVGEAVPAVRARKIPTPGQAIRRLVPPQRLCARGVPAQGFRARPAHPSEVRICGAALGRHSSHRNACAVIAWLGCRGDQRRTATHAIVRRGLGRASNATLNSVMRPDQIRGGLSAEPFSLLFLQSQRKCWIPMNPARWR